MSNKSAAETMTPAKKPTARATVIITGMVAVMTMVDPQSWKCVFVR